MVVRRQASLSEQSVVGQSAAPNYLVSTSPVQNNYMWHRPYNPSISYTNLVSPDQQQQQRLSWNTLASCRIEWFNDRNQPVPAGKFSKMKGSVSSDEGGFYHRNPLKNAWSEASQHSRNWTPVENTNGDCESDATSCLVTLSNGVGERVT